MLVILDHASECLNQLARPLINNDVWMMSASGRVFTQADHEEASSNWLVSGVGTCVDSSLCLIVYRFQIAALTPIDQICDKGHVIFDVHR